MFDDDGHHHHQFHKFTASSTASLPIHHLHGNPPFSAPPAFHHPYQELIPNTKTTDDEGNHLFLPEEAVPWSSDEVAALLNLRSGMGVNVSFSADFIWEHVSRKFQEMGLKRSPEECKRKYCEETRKKNLHMSFTATPSSFTKIFSELEELYPDNYCKQEQNQQIPVADEVVVYNKTTLTRKKRKRKEEEEQQQFEMVKGLVGKMIAQQEELHEKLIQDMVRREEEKAAREAAWKRQEMERVDREMEMRVKQAASAGARQATLVEFLTTIIVTYDENPNYPVSFPSPNNSSAAVVGVKSRKRWPRDEILALIKLRCNNNEGPLWERISAGMMEVGYRRSAKRCKEKWENINKYFRKTRDSNKKRSIESRTCPYFHQLTCLYTRGTLQLPPNSTPDQ